MRLLLCLLPLFCFACRPAGRDQPKQAEGPALYGQVASKPAAQIARVRPNSTDRSWKQAAFSVVQTELSPGTLFHCGTNQISFFTRMSEHGLGGPSYAACAMRTGIKIYEPGEHIPADGLEEGWILVWFAGAKGWTNWDSPWVVYLQNKPTRVHLNEEGLHFNFRQSGGDIVLFPLYGYYKAPLAGADFLAQHGLPSKKIKTWEWSKSLPTEPLMRVRYWASALKEFPLYCEDSFSVDRSRDSVTIRQRFTFHSIDDAWNTKHIKLAPLSPPLALATLDKQFPVTFSQRVFDHDYFTPYGPYMGIEQVDSYDATFRVLQYVNETEAADPVATNAHPTVEAALQLLAKTAREKFREPDKYNHDHGGLGNFCWAIQGDQWYAKALPYMDPQTRQVAMASLRKYFREEVLVTNRFKLREFPKNSGRNYNILEGPGIGSWGALGDAGKFSANMLETLWAYAHYTGDWDLIAERWDLIRKLFCTPAEMRWVSFGRDAIAELGDEAAPCIAMARMAYKTGDIDTYNYACYVATREFVHHYVKQRGAEYFRKHQPWHSMESMDDEVYLTNLWGDTAAWQIDGPNYPAQTGERQFNNRWVRFKDSDVGRFYQDYLKADVKRELDRLQARWEPKRKYHNDSHIMPSLVQLRSLLLNETPAELANIALPGQFSGPPSGIIASCLAVVRTSHPARYVRLIPAASPSPFVAGLEREVSGPNIYLTQSIQVQGNSPAWPEVAWWKGWKTPNGHRWSFGHVVSTSALPAKAKMVPLNWNSQALIFSE